MNEIITCIYEISLEHEHKMIKIDLVVLSVLPGCFTGFFVIEK